MTDIDRDFIAGIEAEIAIAREATGQLHARLMGQQTVVLALLQRLGLDHFRIEQWAAALQSGAMQSINEESDLVCEAIQQLPVGAE
jgi:arabinogalactan endo-1,4-beta-galactosidase